MHGEPLSPWTHSFNCSKAGSGRVGLCSEEGMRDGHQEGRGGKFGASPQVASGGAPATGGGAGAHVAGGLGRWHMGEGRKLERN